MPASCGTIAAHCIRRIADIALTLCAADGASNLNRGYQTVEKCVNCQYYDRRNARPNDGRAPVMWGQCRRHSPHLSPVAGKKAYLVEGVWPLVRDDDWCGEWRAPARSTIGRTRFGVRP